MIGSISFQGMDILSPDTPVGSLHQRYAGYNHQILMKM